MPPAPVEKPLAGQAQVRSSCGFHSPLSGSHMAYSAARTPQLKCKSLMNPIKCAGHRCRRYSTNSNVYWSFQNCYVCNMLMIATALSTAWMTNAYSGPPSRAHIRLPHAVPEHMLA